MNENKLFDKIIEGYDKKINKKVEYRTVYVKPKKWRAIIGFAFSLVFFMVILTVFTFSFMYFLLFFGSLAVLVYYGVNAFTEKGFGLPRTIQVLVEDEDKENLEEK